MAGDITRFTFHALGFFTSETIKTFSNAEIGQYVLLMCESILLGKECSLPDNLQYLSRAARTTVRGLSGRVLDEYPVVLTEFGPRRRNDRLYQEWLRISAKTEAARDSVSARTDRGKKVNPLVPTKDANERITDDQRTTNVRSTNRTEQNNTEQNNTEQSRPSVLPGVGDTLDEVVADLDAGKDPAAVRGAGEPGFFKRGQYPGTDPKKIWAHCSTVYRRIVGESGYLRYPTKHPQAQTDKWSDLCQAVSSDLIVPAFELWVAREGKNIKTQWALSEFLKGDTAGNYLEMVSPRNTIKPKITKEQVKASDAASLAARNELFDTKTSTEPGPEAF